MTLHVGRMIKSTKDQHAGIKDKINELVDAHNAHNELVKLYEDHQHTYITKLINDTLKTSRPIQKPL